MIGLAGVLIALAGTALIVHSFFAMQKQLNVTRTPDAQFKGIPLLPPQSSLIMKTFRAEHPGHPVTKRLVLGGGMILAGIAIMTATNSYNANHN